MQKIVKPTKVKLVLISSLNDPNTLGINKKTEKGLRTPPVKNKRNANCIISIVKKTNAALLFSKLFLKKYIKYKLVKTPNEITKLDNKKLNSKLKINLTELIVKN
tara:strand:- start:300 stop:614 length:315 start_codon:yes stop_codon:yes gene_type:complete